MEIIKWVGVVKFKVKKIIDLWYNFDCDRLVHYNVKVLPAKTRPSYHNFLHLNIIKINHFLMSGPTKYITLEN